MAKTKYQDCVSIAGVKACKKLQEYEEQTTRKQLMADFDDEDDLICKAKLAGVSWIKLVSDLTKEILEQQTTLLLVEQAHLKAEIETVRRQIEERGLTVKSGSVEVDWRKLLRTPPGMIW